MSSPSPSPAPPLGAGAAPATLAPVAPSPSQSVAPAPKPAYKVSTAEGFVVGALSACTAVTVTNPMEVCKTRLQLQGELATGAGAPGQKRLYTSAFDAFVKTVRSEGARGIQRGLGAAFVYQMALNGSRLGFYEPFRKWINKYVGGRSEKEVWAPAAFAAGASSGVVGAVFGNPLYLVKARMQAYSPLHTIGRTQHHYRNVFHALATIVRTDGLRGLTRGVDAAMLRTAMGSSVQLPSYNFFKAQLVSHGLLPADSFWTYLAASTFSGGCVCAVMQPADTALTRMYNQPTKVDANGVSRGTLYRNPIHCLYLTWKAEGVRGWYKGSTAHLARIAPHTVLTLVMNEAYLRWYQNVRSGRPFFA